MQHADKKRTREIIISSTHYKFDTPRTSQRTINFSASESAGQRSQFITVFLFVLAFTVVISQTAASINDPYALYFKIFAMGWILQCSITAALLRDFRACIQMLLVLLIGSGISYTLVLVHQPSDQVAKDILKFAHSNKRGRLTLDLSGKVINSLEYRKPGEVVFPIKAYFPEGKGKGEMGLLLLRAPYIPWHDFAKVQPGCFLSLTASVRLSAFPPGKRPAPFSYNAYLFRRSIVAHGYVKAQCTVSCPPPQFISRESKYTLVAKLQNAFGEHRSLPVILASTLGARHKPGKVGQSLFKELGISHLLVISGFHIGLVFYFVFRLFCWLLKRWEVFVINWPVFPAAAVLSSVFVLWYTWFVDGGISSSRALIAVLFIAVAQTLNRKVHRLRAMSIAFIGCLFVVPGCFFEAGFQLTFAALLGLFVADAVPLPRCVWILRGVLKTANLCFGAWLFTTPVVVLWFGQIVPFGWLINLFVAPVYSMLCIGGGAVGTLLFAVAMPGSKYFMWSVLRMSDALVWLLWCLHDVLAEHGLLIIEVSKTHRVWVSLVFGISCLMYCMIVRKIRTSMNDLAPI